MLTYTVTKVIQLVFPQRDRLRAIAFAKKRIKTENEGGNANVRCYLMKATRCRNFLRNWENCRAPLFLREHRIPYVVTYKIIIMNTIRFPHTGQQVSLYRILSRWKSDRYGLPQRKSLLPEYLITPIISTRSHRGLHSNASWSNTITSLSLTSLLVCCQRVDVCNADYYYDEIFPR